jgi:hypothetical protein
VVFRGDSGPARRGVDQAASKGLKEQLDRRFTGFSLSSPSEIRDEMNTKRINRLLIVMLSARCSTRLWP